MSAPVVIRTENLSKCYRISHLAKQVTLRDAMHHGLRLVWRRFRWNARLTREEFWALRDVAFEVRRGEVLGIIGRNGAGKSTLLKILSRITEPTAGRVTLHGRVASLLEVGTGFHPELTGRDNIFLNGAVLGMRRAEIRARFDEIVAFAEVEKFIDTPVKRYSSGMYVRLAFAVAAHLEPEILIVDEVLAVGDADFQAKCLGKMESIARVQARTVLFVSHNIAAVSRFCTRCILLDSGRLTHDGSTEDAVNRYSGAGQTESGDTITLGSMGCSPDAPVQLISLVINSGAAVVNRRPFYAALVFRANQPIAAVGFGIGFCSIHGHRILTLESDYGQSFMKIDRPGEYSVQLTLQAFDLVPGRYHVDVGAFGGNHEGYHYVPGAVTITVLPGSETPIHLHAACGDWRPSGLWELEPRKLGGISSPR